MTKSIDTKQKIMEKATELFAQNGFNGVSIRKIAQSAEVNLAAINYHFKSKAHLYVSILIESRKLIASEMTKAAEGCINTFETSMAIFEVFIKNEKRVSHLFSMITSKATQEVQDALIELGVQYQSPPGSDLILRALERDYSNSLDSSVKKWAAGAIFSQIGHTALISGSAIFQEICKHSQEHFLNINHRQSVELSIQAIIQFAEKDIALKSLA